ncbi:aspartyl-tRNA(Asn)/glutamyl-tRNA(Gln) amidotransferase subunit A [Humitalea rosea]|uniref:Aspartyl-tRNA(Asn)/glutamyl-tRNA(Gln) amidotransferase subunit A n=1 Tax=Humitalea rosea TaxID=990373 RepID=A0A2W7J2E6_9PROT|nr:amidase [Humitalea rosea]PZW45807.1 aspartyl-tRNA(Asn)/glutamyl-tRNA(Gln) amidotransferase subunit A [Humitalea rosea]
MTEDICLLSAAEAGRRFAARRLSPVAHVRALLGRIAAIDGQVRAYITTLPEAALAAAKRAEAEIAAGRVRGPLHGVAFAVKDNFHVAGVPTTGASRLMQGHVAAATAHVIHRLEAAGAILLGKLNAWEYGTGTGAVHFDLPYPVARNPWDLDRFTGGSSTGSAAAVAAGIAPFALGSDTGGSIRLPAAACGLAGLKPSYGRTSRAGALPNCWSLDVTGALCWTVEDSAIVLNAIAGHDPGDPGSADWPVPDYVAGLGAGVAGLTIGLVQGLPAAEVHPDIAAGLEAAALLLESRGARLVEVALPMPLADIRRAASTINTAESHSIHEDDFRERAGLMGQALRDKMTSGSMVRAADYLAAQRLRRDAAARIDALFRRCDLLLLPGNFRVAPRFDDPAGTIAFTRETSMNIASLSGHPAMAVPCGFDPAGMPLSLQLIGPYFAEARLLRAARVVEAARGDRARRPELRGGTGPDPAPVPVDRAARDAELAAVVAANGAALPRMPAKDAEPAGVFRIQA